MDFGEAAPSHSGREQVPSGEKGEGDAAESSQAVIPAPTRWCGKTSHSEKCLRYRHSRSKPGPCHGGAAVATPGTLWPGGQGRWGTPVFKGARGALLNQPRCR